MISDIKIWKHTIRPCHQIFKHFIACDARASLSTLHKSSALKREQIQHDKYFRAIAVALVAALEAVPTTTANLVFCSWPQCWSAGTAAICCDITHIFLQAKNQGEVGLTPLTEPPSISTSRLQSGAFLIHKYIQAFLNNCSGFHSMYVTMHVSVTSLALHKFHYFTNRAQEFSLKHTT
jgi:hypothetical protein